MTDAATLTALADRLKAGEVGDKIDEELGRAFSVATPTWTDATSTKWVVIDQYTTDLEACYGLHQAVLPGWEWSVEANGHCCLIQGTLDGFDALGGELISTHAPTPQNAWLAAICLARAKELEDADPE